MRKLVSLCMGIFLLSLLLVGCGNSAQQKEIKLGATSGPHAEIAEAVAKEAQKEGLNVKVVEFSDYLTPDQALADGNVDIVGYQHEPFLQNFNKEKNTDLVPLDPIYLMPMGVYSDKYHSIAEIPNGAKIAVPNDPSNEGRGLQLLQKAGLIHLKDGVGYKATLADITANPKHLQFVELDAAQLPRSLSDVDAAAITMNYVMSSGIDVKKQGIYLEDASEPIAVVILATRAQDKDNLLYKKLAEVYHSQAVQDFIRDQYKGTITPAP